ncbi:MAG: Gldg family protein [Gammaproteobacteria bacterium]
METKTSRQTSYLAFGLGVLSIVLFFVINIVSQQFLTTQRLDFSDTKRFTLSSGTRSILETLEEPVTLRFYFSRQMARQSPALTNYANRVLDMLNEYARIGGDKIILNIIEPAAFSEAEDQALDYGLQGVSVDNEGSELFFGLVATNATSGIMIIPFFQTEREAFLEYDISQLVYQLANPKLPVVATISSLPVQGQLSLLNPEVKPWVIWEQLNSVFETRILRPDLDQVEEDVDVLLLIQPRELTDGALKAIDRFVMRGGRVLAFLDPFSEVLGEKGEDPSSLSSLLTAWGVDYIPNKAVAYRDAANRVRYSQDGRDMVDPYPLWMTLTQQHLSQEDSVTSQLQNIIFASPGFLKHRDGATSTFKPLIEIPNGVMTVPAESVEGYQHDPKSLLRNYKVESGQFVVGARLTGTIASAFEADKSTDKANIILVADSDFLFDDFWVQVQNFAGTHFAVPMAGNGHFVLGAVENLAGNNALISVRNRTNFNRPFDKIQAIQTQAEMKFRDKEAVLIEHLESTKQKLLELEEQKEANNALTLTVEQQQTEAAFKQEMLEIRKQLRQVRHDLNNDIETLENTLKFINIFLMPLLICLFGFAMNIIYTRGYAKRLARKLYA